MKKLFKFENLYVIITIECMFESRFIRMERKLDYSKLWKLLVDKKMSKAALRKAIEISPNTLTKLRKEEVVSMEVILKICNYLDCDISDIVEYK